MPLKKIPVLIIEDSEVDLWLITFMLKKIGDIKILNTAKTGTDGIKLIEKYIPRLIFLDLDLPGVSGIEIARIIRKKKIDSDIVFVTSFEQYAKEVMEFNPFDYLIKPLSLEILTDMMKRYRTELEKE